MNRKRLSIVILTATLVFAGLLGAGATAVMQAKPTAAAVVDLEQVFSNLKEKTAIEAEVNQLGEKLQQTAKDKRDNINQLRSDLEVLKAGTDAYEQQQEKVQEAVIEFQVWSRFQQQKLKRERGVQMENLYRKSLDAIAQVAQDNGYDLVLFKEGPINFNYESSQDMAQQIQMRKVLYADDALDVTDQVVQRMNNQYESRR